MSKKFKREMKRIQITFLFNLTFKCDFYCSELPETEMSNLIDLSPDRSTGLQFHENRGRNIELSPDRCIASRIESYNQGVVLSSKPLSRGMLFQVIIRSERRTIYDDTFNAPTLSDFSIVVARPEIFLSPIQKNRV